VISVKFARTLAGAAGLFAHRSLLAQLVARDVSGRYKGSFGGIVWAALTPLMMLAVYVFVFGVVFRPRGQPQGTLGALGLELFCGMLVHGLFAECLVRAPTSVVAQPSYVKRVVFPLQLLPLVVVGGALAHCLVGLAVLLLAALVLGVELSGAVAWLPAVLAGVVLLSAGVSWIIGALSVFLRDLGQVTGLASMVLLFMSPVFYPLTAIPEDLRWIARANPLTLPIEAMRDVLLHARAPDLGALSWHALAGAAVAMLGLAFFQSVRHAFADVL